MRVLLITLGSHGDIHPFFALARELTARGHTAVVATNLAYAQQAARAGVTITEAADGGGLDVAEIMRTADVMHPTRGPRVVLKELLLPLVPKLHARTTQLLRELKPDVALIHPICLGAHWACERAGVPVVPVILAPMGWMASHDQRVMVHWRSHDLSVRSSRLDSWVGKHLMRFMLDGPLNRVRRELGLPKRRDLLVSEFLRPGLNLGLWSPHLRGPRPGDPEGGVICGFPWFDDHHDHQAADDELEEFLNAGEPPIVFTLGTAAVHVPGDFYAHAAAAAQDLGKRAILLVGRKEYAERYRDLPHTIRTFTYAPFTTLLPRAAATVHHGGIGTTAQGLRAGKPTVVVPLAHDQFDNAARVKRLGVSETVQHRHADRRALTNALRAVLDRPDVATRAASLGQSVRTEDGAITAVAALERAIVT